MKTVPILFTFDQKLLMPAGVCLFSLLESADKETFYDIFILHGPGCDFSALNILKEQFDRFSLTDMEINGEFKGAYEIRGIPETAYYRLLSPELIPQYDKLLYSDVDVIIREDLGKYYDLDLGNNYFAAVDNCSALRPPMQQYIAELGLDYRNKYYYSGNLVINSGKLILNKEAIDADLHGNWAVVAEAIQTILRREGYPNPYETLKALTRTGSAIDGKTISDFIDTLDIEEGVKAELRAITPWNYTGF